MSFPASIPSARVVKKIASVNTKSENLLPFEFGIFDEDTNLVLSPTAVPSKRRVWIGVGSPNVRQTLQGSKLDRITNQNNADVTFKNENISPRAVDLMRAQSFRKDEKTNIYYLGYNGIDICESLKWDCGKTYKFHVMVKGRPVRSIFGHEMREVIEVQTGCCATCSTDCTGSEPCERYIDELVSNFNNSLWVGRFFTAEKVINCSPELDALTRTNFVEYCLTVCDNGDELSLAAVQNAYPTLKVEVKSRNAPYTTYRVIKTSGLPSAFSQTDVVLQNCATCPSGYTAVAAGYAYLIQVDNELLAGATGLGGSTDKDKAETLAGFSGGQAITTFTLVTTNTDNKIYSIITNTAITSPLAGFVVLQSLGTTLARCTQDSPVSTAWVSCDTWYKVQRDLCLTVKVDDCDANADGAGTGETLSRLTTFLSGLSDYVASSVALDADSTDCLLRYTISQYNNAYLQDGCDTEGYPKFDTLPPFEGQQFVVCPCEGWTVDGDTGCPVPPVPTDRCCQCGIKFTGKPTTQLIDQFPGYDFNTYLEKDPIELSVTVYRDDNDTNICDFPRPTWFQAQKATFRQLRGDDVIKRVIMDRFYEAEPWVNQIDKENQLFLQREGIKLGVSLQDYYYVVDVYYNVPQNQNYTASHSSMRECLSLLVHEKDLAVWESLKTHLAQAFPDAKRENFV